MLNTIYEEFDIRSKLKDLKNKKIKIKRIVKKKEMAESIIVDGKELQNQFVNYQSERQIQKQKNPLFYSTTFTSEPRNNLSTEDSFFNQNSLRESKILDEGDSGKNPMAMRKSKGNPSTRQVQKSANPMFYSSTNPMKQSMSASEIGQTLKEFMLPKTILRVLDEEEPNMQKIISHIEREKRKIDVDIDQTVSQILSRINDTKRKLHKQLDDYLEMFRKNYEVMKNKCKEFKEKALFAKPSNDRNYLCSLKKLTYYGKMSNSLEPFKKLKEEPSKLEATIENLEKEVARKELTLFAEELNKQSLHVPLYNHSETSQLLLTELRQQLIKGVDEALDNFNHLIFVTEYPDFSTFSCSPDYTSVVSVDKTAAIGEFRELRVLSALGCSKFENNCYSNFVSSGLLSFNTAVTGSDDGTLCVWDLDQENLIDKLVLKSEIKYLFCFRGYDFDFEAKSNTLANTLIGNKETDRKDFIACLVGDELEILKFENSELMPMKIHYISDSIFIKGILPLYDGVSLGLIKSNGNFEVINMTNGKSIFNRKISELPLTSINISKDYKTLAIGGEEKKIWIFSNNHNFSISSQKQVFENVTLIKVIDIQAVPNCLNFGTLEKSLLYLGCNDSKIRVVNIANSIVEKEIVGHKSKVNSINIFENPFDYSHKRNYILLSTSTEDPQIRVSTPYSALNNALTADYSFNTSNSQSLGIIKNENSEIFMMLTSKIESKQVFYKIKLN